jgi:adenosylcobinamide-phosphate synthase
MGGATVILVVSCAFLVDLLVGDPRWLPHPVIAIGRMIQALEKRLRSSPLTSSQERLRGAVLALVVIAVSAGITAMILKLLYMVHPWVGKAAEVWLISTTIATRGLAAAGYKVAKQLREENIEQARYEVGMIVSRDTSKLSQKEIIRAAVESVAENIVDAVIAPLFYACIGGAPLAMAYRATNTLDSMVGYKNDRYLHFGYVSAKLDDWLNWVPARITAILIVLASWLTGVSGAGAWKIIFRDAKKHPSPNSGIPEAGVAGALGIRLGGYNVYHDRVSFREYMGDAKQELNIEHIDRTIRILFCSPFLFLVGIWLIVLSWKGVFQ